MFSKVLTGVSVLFLLLCTVAGSPAMAQDAPRTPATSPVVRIKFAAGATEAAETGTLTSSRVQVYLIRAGGGQTMMVNVSGSDASLRVAVYPRFYRRPLRGGDNTQWTGRLPWTGDYLIRVTGNISTQYSLGVTIPQRITFRRRAVSATINGMTDAHRTVTYLLRASSGQIMSVMLSSSVNVSPTAPNLGLTIYGLSDGNPLVRAEGDATSWSGVLPGTQDYVIEAVPALDTPITYTLGVTVTWH